MAAGKPSQQISNENGRSVAGMYPGGMIAREANPASMMLAMSLRVVRLRGLKRISHGIILREGILPGKEGERRLFVRAGPDALSRLRQSATHQAPVGLMFAFSLKRFVGSY